MLISVEMCTRTEEKSLAYYVKNPTENFLTGVKRAHIFTVKMWVKELEGTCKMNIWPKRLGKSCMDNLYPKCLRKLKVRE